MLSDALASLPLGSKTDISSSQDDNKSSNDTTQALAEKLRLVVCQALAKVDDQWMQMKHPTSGTTVTMAILVNNMLTIANIGDSTAILDTGCSILELTCSHRIADSVTELMRLKAAGCEVAPLGFHLQGPAKNGEKGVGPLRVWPGGLCVARTIGDADVGPHVIPIPHIRQLVIPEKGCRVILATDGLWDVVPAHKVAVQSRGKLPAEAIDDLMQQVESNNRIIDDTSIIIVDISPVPIELLRLPSVSDGDKDSISKRFTPVAWSDGGALLPPKPFWGAGSPSDVSSGGCFSCFAPEVIEPDSREVQGEGRLDFFADVDCLKEYPGAKDSLVRNSLVRVHRSKPSPPSARNPPNSGSIKGDRPRSFQGGASLANVVEVPVPTLGPQSTSRKINLQAGSALITDDTARDAREFAVSDRKTSPATSSEFQRGL